MTAPVPSSTLPVAISPARPEKTFTVQIACSNVASVTGLGG